MSSIEKWGTTVEEAVEYALQEMKLTEDQVEITVLEEPSRGFFGIGSKLAKVKVEKKLTEEEKKAEEKKASKRRGPIDPEEIEKKKPEKKHKKKEKKEKKETQAPAVETDYRATPNIALDGLDKESLTVVEEHEALDFLKEVTDKMGLKLDYVVRTGENLIYIEMSGDDSRTIIGKRGQTLDAIQYLTSLVVNKDEKEYIKVVLDAENYRAKRQRTLEQLANRLAGKATRTGKHVRLEPMNPYERKVIHATLQHHPDVVTRSEGEEPYRKVIIEKKQ